MKPFITFVSLPQHTWYPPYGLLSLASYLKRATGLEAGILNLTSSKDFEKDMLEALRERRPEYVGFSCFTSDFNDVMRLAAAVKKETGAKVMVGNAHASLFPEDFIYEGSPVDYAVIGEGEVSLAELALALSKGEDPGGIPGIAMLGPGGKFSRGPKRDLIPDLGVLPPLDHGLIDMAPYLSPFAKLFVGISLRTFLVHTSRGCPSVCEFCAANTIWKCNSGFSVRSRPLEAVIAEIDTLKEKYGIQAFLIADDSFTINKKRVLEFCREIKSRGLIWGCQARILQVDEEMIVAMKEAGCVMLMFGVESGSDQVLARIRKGQTAEQIARTFGLCKKHGMKTLADIMCNHPGETEEDIRLTQRLLDRIRPDELSLSVMTPYPGTAIYDKYVHPRLEKAQYDLLKTRGPAVVKYFKLCLHDLPLQEVLNDYSARVYNFRLPTSVSLLGDSRYFKKVFLDGNIAANVSALGWDLFLRVRISLLGTLSLAARKRIKAKGNRLRNRLERVYSPPPGTFLKKLFDSILGTPSEEDKAE